MSLDEENIDLFRKTINDNCTLTDEDFEEKVLIDVPMPMEYASMDFIHELDKLEPFGNGNPKPLFAQKNLRFISGRVLGANRNVGKYNVADENDKIYEMIYFGDIEGFNSYIADKFGPDRLGELYNGGNNNMSLSVIYYPDINEFRGNVSVQMVMKYYQ